MPRLKSFASTTVSLAKTQDEMEDLFDRVGVQGRRWSHLPENRKAHTPGKIVLEFDYAGSGYRISVEYRFEEGPRGGNRGTTREQAARALYWHTKNVFDAIAYGITTMEQAFLPYMITERGTTMAEMVEAEPALLHRFTSGESRLFALEYQR